MDMPSLIQWAFAIILLGGLVIVFAYLLVRGASFAYFRTRLEYLIKRRKLMKGE